jgi:hypothetical protein
VIDRRYALDEIVEAHRYVDLGHKKGNVIVTVARSRPAAWADRCRRFVLGEFLAGPEGIATDGIDWQGTACPRDRSGSWPELEGQHLDACVPRDLAVRYQAGHL